MIGAELLFSFLGLGFLLNVGRQLNDVSQVIAIMLVIMGIIMEIIVGIIMAIIVGIIMVMHPRE